MAENILIVDDEETVREIVSSTLTSVGYRCQQASSGKEALAILKSDGEFALMLCELTMSDLDGIGLLERAKERFPDMPVIMATAVNDISEALKAIRKGAYDYLLKPFERDQLLNTVKRALENRRLKLEDRVRTFQLPLEARVAEQPERLRRALANLRQANADLKRSHDMTLEALGEALDVRDAETLRHSKRVTAFTIAIARVMELPDEEVEAIAHGGFLHDIGKMAIPDSVLRKPGPLNEQEFLVMREHCLRGYQMVSKISFLADAAEIVYAHQERWDGTGYPRGLKGEEIPLGARMTSVANTLDAITSDWPYRAAQSYQAARREIERGSGRQFDPVIVKVSLNMPESIWESVRRQVGRQEFGVPPDVGRIPGNYR
jgi:putative nucleotidyltransferase with HDIG domain